MSFGFGGGDVLRKQVEILINATGQQGLDDLNQGLQNTERFIDTLAQAARNGHITWDQFLQDVKQSVVDLKSFQTAGVTAEETIQAFARGFATVAEMRAHDTAEAKRAADEQKDIQRELEHNLKESLQRQVDAARAAARDRADEVARSWAREEDIERRREEAVSRVSLSAEEQARRMRAASRAVLELSRGLEDLTVAGPIGALNNIPTMFYAIAQSVGWSIDKVAIWTAGVSVAATAAYALYKNWDLVQSVFRSDMFDRQAGSVNKLKKEMEELEKKTWATGQEMQRLSNIKQEIADREFMDKLARDPTKQEEDVKKAFKKAASELGPGGAGGAGTIESAVHEAVVSGFARMSKDERALAVIMAGQRGELGVDSRTGKQISPTTAYFTDDDYRRKMDAIYFDTVVKRQEEHMIAQIGKQGDVGALRQFEQMLGGIGTFTIDKFGKTIGKGGEEVKALSELFGAIPERAKARRAAEEAEKERVKEVETQQKKDEQERKKVIADSVKGVSGEMLDDVMIALAQAVIDKSDPDKAKAAARAEIARRLATEGLGGPLAEESIDEAMKTVDTDFRARMVKMARPGESREETAAHVQAQTKARKRAADAAAQAQREQEKEEKDDAKLKKKEEAAMSKADRERKARIDKAVGKVSPSVSNTLQAFLAQNALANRQRQLARAQPMGRQMIREADQDAARRKREVHQQIQARNRDREFKKQWAAATPEEQQMRNLQDQLALQTTPMPQVQAQQFAGRVATQAIRAGGGVAPGDVGAAGAELASRAQQQMAGKVAAEFQKTGNMQAALANVQLQVMTQMAGEQQRLQGQVNRLMNGFGMVQQRLRNNRQTQQNVPRN